LLAQHLALADEPRSEASGATRYAGRGTEHQRVAAVLYDP
jgi:hypothetical protein